MPTLKANDISPAPVYTSELAPPALRGLFVGMDGFGIALGTCLANYMGTSLYIPEFCAAFFLVAVLTRTPRPRILSLTRLIHPMARTLRRWSHCRCHSVDRYVLRS